MANVGPEEVRRVRVGNLFLGVVLMGDADYAGISDSTLRIDLAAFRQWRPFIQGFHIPIGVPRRLHFLCDMYMLNPSAFDDCVNTLLHGHPAPPPVVIPVVVRQRQAQAGIDLAHRPRGRPSQPPPAAVLPGCLHGHGVLCGMQMVARSTSVNLGHIFLRCRCAHQVMMHGFLIDYVTGNAIVGLTQFRALDGNNLCGIWDGPHLICRREHDYASNQVRFLCQGCNKYKVGYIPMPN
jgi:hypothetical protein